MASLYSFNIMASIQTMTLMTIDVGECEISVVGLITKQGQKSMKGKIYLSENLQISTFKHNQVLECDRKQCDRITTLLTRDKYNSSKIVINYINKVQLLKNFPLLADC